MNAGSTTRTARLAGVLAPLLTPFGADLEPDAGRFLRHARWLLAHGCAGLAPFGTTSEANSLAADERMRLLDELVAGGIDPERLMPGTGCCALPDSVRLTRHAVSRGCAGVLMLPPFYYKGVSDDGLFRSFAELIERVGDHRLRVYLYHIPPVAQVGFGPRLVERLLSAYPGTVAGIKDSSGDFAGTKVLLDGFASTGFDVFVGSERFLLQNLRHGGVGCITATGNVNPGAIDRLYREWRSEAATGLQEGVNSVRAAVERAPVIPSLKQIVAHHSGDDGWLAVRPPLTQITQEQASALFSALAALDFGMPDLA